MYNDSQIKIRWEVTDPQGRQVVLKENTYEHHVIGDHDTQDVKIRARTEKNAKQTIINPNLIAKDDSTRHLYYNAVAIRDEENNTKVKLLKVVVDADRTPNEVVTWTPIRKGDNLGCGAIIYERGAND